MAITRIFIENFKGIGPMVEVPMKPITLLFGANSAGKSTILQALLYLRQVLEKQDANADKIELSGSAIDLGSFPEMVHCHDTSRCIKLGLDVVGLDHIRQKLDGTYRGEAGFLFDACADNSPDGFFTFGLTLTIKYDASNGRCYVSEVATRINKRDCCRVVNLNDHFYLKRFDLSVPELQESQAKLREDYTFDSDPPPDPDYVFPQRYSDLIKSLAEQNIILDDSHEINIPLKGNSIFRLTPSLKCMRDDIHFNELYNILIEQVSIALERTKHIGNVRISPERSFRPSEQPRHHQWTDGTFAWDYVQRYAIDNTDRFNRVNEYISSPYKLGLGYRFSLIYFKQLAVGMKPLTDLRNLSSNKEIHEIQMAVLALQQAVDALPTLPRLELHSTANGIEVKPKDVGTGFSQLLPIVVGSVSPSAAILLIEQPELHVHPAVQCAMSDLFLHECKEQPDKQFLIETHSEHLMLRMLRRVRETRENALPEGAPACTPHQISVLYVESTPAGTTITPLPISVEGDFERQWPDGFFEERAGELFS